MGSGIMQCWINGPATGGIDDKIKMAIILFELFWPNPLIFDHFLLSDLLNFPSSQLRYVPRILTPHSAFPIPNSNTANGRRPYFYPPAIMGIK
jgi:hypothetical protein